MRIMGLDFGSKTVGVAISDPLLITAQGIEIVRRKEENKLRQTLARIEELITEYEVKEIVLGYPKHMNDSEGDRVALTKEFADDHCGCRPYHDRGGNPQGKQERACGSNRCGSYSAGISGLQKEQRGRRAGTGRVQRGKKRDSHGTRPLGSIEPGL